MTCIITPSGEIRFVWSDAMAPMRDLGEVSIRRASHVEPTDDGRWMADMGPSDGPVLGPFELHQQAIQAEREWLSEFRGL